MNTLKLTGKNKPQMIAHRGCSGLERENTASAFVAAGNRSYYGIETDIHVTVDGKYILIHDDHTARVAVDNLTVEESTFDTLRKLTLIDKFNHQKVRADLCLPTLQEYINICKKYEKTAVLELKNEMAKENVLEIVKQIEEMDYLDHVTFISFAYQNLVYLREEYPNQSAQFLISKFPEDLIDRLKAYNLDLDIYFKALTKENIALCHENGIKVNCWTVDTLTDARRLSRWGVDYITSNIVE